MSQCTSGELRFESPLDHMLSTDSAVLYGKYDGMTAATAAWSPYRMAVVLHWGVGCWHSPFYGCGATLRCRMLALSLLWLWCYTEVSDAGTLPSMAVVLHWGVGCWHSPFYGCGATLRCRMLALSLLWLWCYTIFGGSCHKYNFCHDESFVVTNTFVMTHLSVTTKHIFCRDKSMLVGTKLLSRETYFCHDRTFVMTNIILSWQNATSLLLLWQTCLLSQ